jgi:hypothetical protein
MAKGTIGSSGVAALCLFIGACTSCESESPSTLSGTTSKAASSESKRAEKKLPLYEAYIRRVQGLRQTKADSPGQRLWGISFLRHKTGKACSSCRIWGDRLEHFGGAPMSIRRIRRSSAWVRRQSRST